MDEESYIVRIYRRSMPDPEGGDGLVGVIEDVAHARRNAFHNVDELVALIKQNPESTGSPQRRNVS